MRAARAGSRHTVARSGSGPRVVSLEGPSGLRVLVAPRPDFVRCFAALSVGVGSVDTAFVLEDGRIARVPEGVAHFLEHELFEKPGGDVAEVFSAEGASVNALTGHLRTAYTLSCIDNAERHLARLCRLVFRPHFHRNLVEKERRIITQEIRMYEDSPEWRGYMALLRGLFVRHPVRDDVAGTVESIGRIGVEDLSLVHGAFYRPGNSVLAVAGPVDPARVLAVAERSAGGSRGSAVRTRLLPSESSEVRVRRVRQRMPVAAGRLWLGFKGPAGPAPGPELLAEELALQAALDLLFGRTGAAWRDLYAEGLIDESFGASAHVEESFAFAVVGGETPRPRELEKRLVAMAERGLDGGSLRRDVERIRRAFLGSFERTHNSMSGTVWTILDCHRRGLGPRNLRELIAGLTPEAVRRAARTRLRTDRLTASYVEPPGEARP